MSGVGIAVLPDFIVGDADDLVRVLDHIAFHRSFWMIVPTSLRQTPRVRVVADMIAWMIREQRPKLIRS